MSSEEQRLESKILYFEDMMFRCKGYEYQKVETIRKEISRRCWPNIQLAEN